MIAPNCEVYILKIIICVGALRVAQLCNQIPCHGVGEKNSRTARSKEFLLVENIVYSPSCAKPKMEIMSYQRKAKNSCVQFSPLQGG